MKYIVRTCTGREKYLEYVKEKIPDCVVSFDCKKDPMNNFKNALLLADNDSCIHFEDDVLLTKDFLNKATRVINKYPDMIVQFFSMRKADIEIGSRIETASTFLCAVCFYTPKKISKGIYNFFSKWDKFDKHPTGLDLLIRDYLIKTKQKYFIAIPNLADHRIGKSAIDPKRSSKRQSFTFKE